MPQLFQGSKHLHCACLFSSNKVLSYRVGWSSCAVKLANVRSARSQMTTGRGGCIKLSRLMRYSCRRTVRENARCPHFSLAIISVTVQLCIQVFWVISLQFNIRNTLPKYFTFLLGHPVYMLRYHIYQRFPTFLSLPQLLAAYCPKLHPSYQLRLSSYRPINFTNLDLYRVLRS